MTTQAQNQTQDDQTQLQNEYPSSAESTHDDAQRSAAGDTQTSQRADAWRPSEDPAIEQAGGISEPSARIENGSSAQDARDETSQTQSVDSRGM